ncbi:hypothetical protein [Bradyrhizobium sp. 143]|uniref:hypothetical protein n=1 Tax=Bradyrhizobium sp. 143 TaxID=2782619 RepID=UPI001FF88E7A|nr:hypothetical protein [Bradyrhizobium sp. 143]MCK1715847.1 hypothetical protein [Bradyrhizobium sp. 143]
MIVASGPVEALELFDRMTDEGSEHRSRAAIAGGCVAACDARAESCRKMAA